MSGSYEVNPLSDDLQFFTVNGRCCPETTPLPVQCGERVRIRLVNPAMMEHPIHAINLLLQPPMAVCLTNVPG